MFGRLRGKVCSLIWSFWVSDVYSCSIKNCIVSWTIGIDYIPIWLQIIVVQVFQSSQMMDLEGLIPGIVVRTIGSGLFCHAALKKKSFSWKINAHKIGILTCNVFHTMRFPHNSRSSLDILQYIFFIYLRLCA